MSRNTHRAMVVRVFALPVVAGVGVLGLQLPHEPGRPPAAVAPQGPPGAATVGTARYPVPDDAVVVSPSGDDGADGTLDEPLRTVGRAIAKARSNATIVLRGGVYHETVTVPGGKRLTIQAHPGEAVWFDGSSPVTRWAARDGRWVSDGWTARFDASPTYTAGAKASADDDFRFVSPQYPMAAHPDQVWVDGVAQRQVGSRDQVGHGAFYVDEGARQLVLGDDPTGKDVRASTLSEAITVRGAGSTLRGLGVRRYATSLPQMGSVKIAAPGVTVEHVAITDSATTGLSVLAAGARIRHVTTARAGMLGIHGNHADDLRVEHSRSARNNLERFKYAPVSGGIKITRSRKVAVTNTVAADNLGKGVWMDESVYDITLTADRIVRNADHGVSLELSAKALVAGNVIRGNGGDGLRLNGTSDAQIWNNTLAKNGRTLHLVQDSRDPRNPATPGRDPRRKTPDPAMTWQIGKTTISNNVLADAREGTPCLLCVEDHTHRRSAAQMDITANGNLYVRPDSTSPRTLVVWSRGAGDPATFPDLGEFRSATGQEGAGQARDARHAAGADGALDRVVLAEAQSAARPLPAWIAEVLGKPVDSRHMGAWGPMTLPEQPQPAPSPSPAATPSAPAHRP
ncbi:right-handed parallel beta-helix repeat-containing protein [Actinomadura hibisca]|uniref:right-handed parallel beta-helix repeat-containing protein n=1 Tax=Actinomadura hibisca TaxID=68565 RepID=UPI00082D10DA|nr:right-handed parallel beta-helix repeat-containing protein [Actinomadura hibisca]